MSRAANYNSPEQVEYRHAYFERYNAKRAKQQRLYMKRYYRAHPEKFSTRATLDARLRHYYRNRDVLKAKRLEKMVIAQVLINTAKSVPCLDCQETFPPYVMDFDHVRGVKSFAISRGGCRSVSKLLEEMAKCDVVCSNCHRLRTYKYKEE